MNIANMLVNHMENPIGYSFDTLRFQWTILNAKGTKTTQVRLRVADEDGTMVFEEARTDFEVASCFDVVLSLRPCTRYYWHVEVESDAGETEKSETAFFETGKMEMPWSAKWLLADPAANSVIFDKSFVLNKPVRRVRLYICGYGLYEAYINGIKLGDEVLMPGYHSYDLTNEYQTIDVTGQLKGLEGKKATLAVLLGNGWYKGRFVFDGGYENIYGDRQKLIAELHITYEDGSNEVIATDEGWSCRNSDILNNSIYDGEVQDYTAAGQGMSYTTETAGELLAERTSMPIQETEYIFPKKIIHTPAGETVLDFGEMITGWVSFYCREEKDRSIRLQYGEWMQNGCFYRDNLREAKAEFVYRSIGKGNWVRPHFTYYGFRYVKVEGITEIHVQDFRASRIRSSCTRNGRIRTGNEKVNRLVANAYASQQCNFLDIPTDCPQRDERMGWTGDIGIFADTACFNMESAAFLQHYLTQLAKEQTLRNGSVPFVVPFPKISDREKVSLFFVLPASCAWGDAAVIVPYTLYEHYQDKNLLRKNYPSMKGWVEYIKGRIQENKIPHLWQNDFQLGDWLALDSRHPEGLLGLTDTGLIASAYYYHSVELTYKAAKILKLEKDAEELQQELETVGKAFTAYYFDKAGNLTVTETQTSYAVILAFGLCPKHFEERLVTRLKTLIEENNGHLTTGFVGTPLLCETLSRFGEHGTACRLFLNEEYPGWLYEVNLGAVTIWERWNSVNQDGIITDTGMNSLNHYAFGSIVAWVYRYLCGFRLCPGERNTLIIEPMHCDGIGFIEGEYTTPWGTYRMALSGEGEDELMIEVPFDGTAIVRLGNWERRYVAGKYKFTQKIGG